MDTTNEPRVRERTPALAAERHARALALEALRHQGEALELESRAVEVSDSAGGVDAIVVSDGGGAFISDVRRATTASREGLE